MHLTDDQMKRLAERTISRLMEAALIELKVPKPDLIDAIVATLQRFMADQRSLDAQVKKLMHQYSSQIETGTIDTQKMYSMIRRQVAKEKKFELDPEEQLTLLSHRIQDRLYNDDLADYTDEDKALRSIKQTLHETLRAEETLDESVRAKIGSLQRHVPEGTPEWEILYRKYMDEELAKKRL